MGRWMIRLVVASALALLVSTGCGGDDGGLDASVPEGGLDAATDASVDASADAPDALPDAAADTSIDAPAPSDAGPDASRDVGPRPTLSYEFGTCEALLNPFPLESEAQRAIAVAIVEALDPMDFLPTFGGGRGPLVPIWDGADDCVSTTGGLGSRRAVDADDGCASMNGADYWGQLSIYSTLLTHHLAADAFAFVRPTGELQLVQLDGHLDRTISGYGVGNPPFHATEALYIRIVGDSSGAGLRGSFYFTFEKEGFYVPAVGYVHAIDTEGGTTGDFCFEATYSGLLIESVVVRSDGVGF